MKPTTGVIPSLAATAGISTEEYLQKMYRRYGSLNRIARKLNLAEGTIKYHARAADLKVVCVLANREQRKAIREIMS